MPGLDFLTFVTGFHEQWEYYNHYVSGTEELKKLTDHLTKKAQGAAPGKAKRGAPGTLAHSFSYTLLVRTSCQQGSSSSSSRP